MFASDCCRTTRIFTKNNWGDFELIIDVLDKIEKQALTIPEIKQLILEVDKVIPDTEDFGDYGGSWNTWLT